MKTAIVYYSKHHENTKQLLDAIRQDSGDEVTLIDVTTSPTVDLAKYDRIGYASGIYFSKFEKKLVEFAKNNTPAGKDVFLIYTCGAEKDSYTKSIREALASCNAHVLGEYGCLGFDTYGPFKLIGGIAKNHPNSDEVAGAVAFYKNLHA